MENKTKNVHTTKHEKKPIVLPESINYLKGLLVKDVTEKTNGAEDVDTRKLWAYGGHIGNIPFEDDQFWVVNRYINRNVETKVLTTAIVNIIMLNGGVPTYNITGRYQHDVKKFQFSAVKIDKDRGPVMKSCYKETINI